MITDPQRARKKDPGDPDVCNVYEFHKLYTESQIVKEIEKDCRKADIGCVECKKIIGKNLANALSPIREKRRYYEKNSDLLNNIIESGNAKARSVAKETMSLARDAMKI